MLGGAKANKIVFRGHVKKKKTVSNLGIVLCLPF